MLIVAKKVLQRGASFATARHRPKKQAAAPHSDQVLEPDVLKAYRKSVEQGSILRQFREEVFRRSQLGTEWKSEQRKTQERERQMQDMLNVDKQEMRARTTVIQARAVQNRNVFDENSGRSLLSDYGNYRPYDKVYPVLQDRNLEEGEFFENNKITENVYKFIDKLPEEYQEKEEIQTIIDTFSVNRQGMSLTEYGKEMQKTINNAQREQMKKYEHFKIHQQQKYQVMKPPLEEDEDINTDWFQSVPEDLHPFTGIPKAVDPWNDSEGFEATLSPRAVDTIYDLYLQGWTVRDISKRFGILPARTKFCVWVRAQLYHEVIPKLGVKYYLTGVRFEQRLNQSKTFMDYGLDMDDMSNDGVLTEIHEWNGKMLDAQRKEEDYRGAMVRLEKEKKFGKYEMVEVGTHDKQNSKYRLKEWVVFRGKGSDEYFLKNRLLKQLTRAHKTFNKVYY